MSSRRIVVVGAGVGGLTAAALLAARGLEVTLVEKAAHVGGKMRELAVGGAKIDSGPTVFTMRWVFDAIFAEAGGALDTELALRPAALLARHAWDATAHFDLPADMAAARDSVAAFFGAAEGRAFAEFLSEAQTIYRVLKGPFLEGERPSPIALARRVGLDRLGDLMALRPFDTMWSALAGRFRDPRLRQLFGRYATYCGSSPFAAPATLMLVAAVEQEGVWYVEGGMARVADALRALGARHGAKIRLGETVTEILARSGACAGVRLAGGETIEADAVVLNADPAALAAGLFGAPARAAVAPIARAQRSQSAITWSLLANTDGFPLTRHGVFFSPDYRAEFKDVFARRRPPADPTVYVCAQDRGDGKGPRPEGLERLLVLINAPPDGDGPSLSDGDLEQCEMAAFKRLTACGLRVDRDPARMTRTTPQAFEALFPATGGALYGRASHGWRASFARPGARTALPGLYLAGGAAHPGPGVPMAALSGRTAARAAILDLGSMRRSRPAATPGGTSTARAPTAPAD